ncbi:MAG TPA: hypothetical protein VKH37_01670, partial [Ferruginibacter sp.]|nr:hypothetical protein [Ferruginibacter sp.]
DAEVNELINKIPCRSFTLILQMNHAATPYWVNISDPKHVVFASSRFNDPAGSEINTSYHATDVWQFTDCMARTISGGSIKVTNKRMFFGATSLIPFKPKLGKPNQLPQLICNEVCLERNFLSGPNPTFELQTRLRIAGFTDVESDGEWDKITARSLATFINRAKLESNLYKQDYIERLESFQSNDNKQPVFLLVFCDPEKKLPAIAEEKQRVLSTLESIKSNVEIVVLDDPTPIDLVNLLRDEKYRNRIELFYFSGKDDDGYMKLKEGTFSLEYSLTFTQYHSNIRLFLMNTCWSQTYASLMTQIGVVAAIGAVARLTIPQRLILEYR